VELRSRPRDISWSALQTFDGSFEILPADDAHDRNGFLVDSIKPPIIGNPQPTERKSKQIPPDDVFGWPGLR